MPKNTKTVPVDEGDRFCQECTEQARRTVAEMVSEFESEERDYDVNELKI